MEDQQNNRTKWLHVRLKPEEFEKLQKRFRRSACLKMSDFLRRHLMKKPLINNYRNRSLDDFMGEMILLRKELNAIGSNLNQTVKKLHTLNQIHEFRQWMTAYELEKRILSNKIDDIKKRIQNIAEKWLQ